jgi:hypothetical protein
MKYMAWAFVALGLLVVAPNAGLAQDGSGQPDVQLHRNYPNPFNPETTIPFSLPQSLWSGSGGQAPVVSLRIYNILAQLVAVPILQGSGEKLEGVQLQWNGTGQYSAYWDGKILETDREAASGVYIYQLIVNGQAVSRKMTVVK